MGGSALPKRPAVFAISLILIVIGLAMIVYGFTKKEVHAVSWGLLVVAYIYFALTSGGAIIFESVHTVLGYKGPKGELSRISKLALWLSIVTIVCAWLIVAAEAARPWIFWRIFTDFNVTSRIAWGDTALALLFVTYSAILVIRIAGGSPEKVKLALAIIGVIFAVVAYGNLALIFGAMTAVPGWYGPHLVALFMVSVILLGASSQALFTMPYIWKDEELKGFLARFYGQIIVLGVLLLAFLTTWNVITAWYRPEAWATYSDIVAGAYSTMFWVVIVLLGIIVVLILALHAVFKRNIITLMLAAALTLISGFVNIYLLIIAHQVKRPEVLEGLYIVTPYHIPISEVIIVIGALMIWPSLYVLGQTLLPLLYEEKPKRFFIFK